MLTKDQIDALIRLIKAEVTQQLVEKVTGNKNIILTECINAEEHLRNILQYP